VCDLASLASKLVDTAIDVILKTITGKELGEWVKEALQAIGFDKILDMVPGVAAVTDAIDQVEKVAELLIGDITQVVTQLKQDLSAMLDMT
jgi:hypothetical protein